jgi:hypothetical protein
MNVYVILFKFCLHKIEKEKKKNHKKHTYKTSYEKTQ